MAIGGSSQSVISPSYRSRMPEGRSCPPCHAEITERYYQYSGGSQGRLHLCSDRSDQSCLLGGKEG